MFLLFSAPFASDQRACCKSTTCRVRRVGLPCAKDVAHPTCPKLEPLAQCTWNSDDLSVWILSWHDLRRHEKCAHCALLSPRKINHFLILTCIGCNAYKCRFLAVGVFHCLRVLIGTVDNNDLISECAVPIYIALGFQLMVSHLFSSCVLRLLLWLLFLPVSSCVTLLVLRLFPVFLFPSAWLLRFPLFLSLLRALFALSCLSACGFGCNKLGQTMPQIKGWSLLCLRD